MSFQSRKCGLSRCVTVSLLAAAAVSISSPLFAAPLAIGTIERIDSRTASIVVMGQTYSVGNATLVAGRKSLPAAQGIRQLSSNALVWVDGELNADGTTKVASLTVLPETNIPGATQLFVAGVVRSVDATGKVRIGSLVIDTTPTIGSFDGAIQVGDQLEFVGTQPAGRGLFVASALAPLRAQGIGGTGAQTQGIGGTGAKLQGIGGTGSQTQGIGGTGAQTQGIGGTGAQTQGIGGTGAKLQGIGGTGAQTQGIGGTGAQTQGIGGTGAQTQGIGGTGAKLQGIGGTGAQTQGIGGTGAQTQGIGGTGAKLQGIGGTGAQTQGIGGTGAQTQGIGGTGKTQGIGGTGAQTQGIGGTGR